jgi:hypothetical protein
MASDGRIVGEQLMGKLPNWGIISAFAHGSEEYREYLNKYKLRPGQDVIPGTLATEARLITPDSGIQFADLALCKSYDKLSGYPCPSYLIWMFHDNDCEGSRCVGNTRG